MFQGGSLSEHENCFDSQVLMESPEHHASRIKQFHSKFFSKSRENSILPYFTMISTNITQCGQIGAKSNNPTTIEPFSGKNNKLEAKLSHWKEELLTQKIKALESMNLDDRTLEDSESLERPYQIPLLCCQDLRQLKGNYNLRFLNLEANSQMKGNQGVNEVKIKHQSQLDNSSDSKSSDFDSSDSESEEIIKLDFIHKFKPFMDNSLMFHNESAIEKATEEEEPSVEMNSFLFENNINESISSFDNVEINVSSRNYLGE